LEVPPKYEEMKEVEQILMTITENGFAKRTSSFEYRTGGRSVQGVKTIGMNERNGAVVAVFPVNESDHVMLVTNSGKLIRCPVSDVRITGRASQGVILFRVDKGERVVSAVRLVDNE
jgi:DNA gyrase subunit A